VSHCSAVSGPVGSGGLRRTNSTQHSALSTRHPYKLGQRDAGLDAISETFLHTLTSISVSEDGISKFLRNVGSISMKSPYSKLIFTAVTMGTGNSPVANLVMKDEAEVSLWLATEPQCAHRSNVNEPSRAPNRFLMPV
jgi:hypothetical protein